MLKRFKRILSAVLLVLSIFSVLYIHASAASSTYCQTAKSNVPIWSAASSSSTKIRTIATKGTVLIITGSTVNAHGNLWYRLSDGYWVFSENVTSHGHSYTGGICTGIGCGYEWPYTVSSFYGTFVVTNSGGAKVWSRPYSNNSTHMRTAYYSSVLSITAVTKNNEGNVWYRLSDGLWVFSGNVSQRFTISYNANGGYGAPGSQYALASTPLTISSARPTKDGYIFQGWSTSAGSSTVSCKPGYSYKFSSDLTLYAVWKACSHSDHTGGICNTCGYEYPLSTSAYSASFVVTNSNGAKIWSRPYSNKSTHVRTANYNTVLTTTGKTINAENHTWYQLTDGYWVYSENVARRYTVAFNANGGSGAPATQYAVNGVSLKIASSKPARIGYVFKGWSTSAGSSTVSCKPGYSYKFSSDLTLYAVWKACSHSDHTGGICNTCGYEYPLSTSAYSATFVVTNSNGAKIWSRPYSNKSTHVRTANYNTVLTTTGKTVNAENHTWYQLTDGYWVYSENVARRYSIKFNANGGSGAPATQYAVNGVSLKIASSKPTRIGYVFKGWSTSAGSSTVSYKPGSSYKFTASKTLYAVWKACSHSNYAGGYCSACNYEYPINVSAYSATFAVTNTKGAKIWSRPYSNKSTHVRTANHNTVLTTTGKTVNAENHTWYQLTDGYWVYSENVARRYSIKFNANGGSGAPATQYAINGVSLKIASSKPTRNGYLFQGWATSAGSKTISYKAGSSYKFTASKTLYAVWSKCATHSYDTKGICTKCKLECPYTVTALSERVYTVTGVTGNSYSAKTYAKPFTGCTQVLSVRKGDLVRVIGQSTVNSIKWFQLKNGSWILASQVTMCGKYSGGTLVYSDTAAQKNVTTVSKITQSTSSAVKYQKKHVGVIDRSATIPGLKQTVTRTKSGSTVTTCTGMVPQGLTFAGNYLLISAYCSCGSSHRSVIYVLDSNTRTYLTTLILDDTCHVGGLAKLGNYLWVCDSGTDDHKEKLLRAYSYADIQTAVSTGANYWSIYAKNTQGVDTTPSYMCSANGYLYVGKFYEETKTAKIYFYSANGTTLENKGYFTIKNVKQIQGISIRGQYMVVTSSYGRYNSSKVYIYKDSSNFTTNKAVYSTPRKTLAFTNMIEGCYIGSSYTYFLFESGAKKYRGSIGARPFDQYIGYKNETLAMY